jgi:hypothetical protein
MRRTPATKESIFQRAGIALRQAGSAAASSLEEVAKDRRLRGRRQAIFLLIGVALLFFLGVLVIFLHLFSTSPLVQSAPLTASHNAAPAAPIPVNATPTPATTASPQLDDVSYSIIKADLLPGNGRSVHVRISRIVSEETLRSIALKIRGQDFSSYDRLFIFYYLPEMPVGAGAWATSHFTPQMEIAILGPNAEQAERLVSQPSSPLGVVGRWIIRGLGASTISIHQSNGIVFLERSFADVTVVKHGSPNDPTTTVDGLITLKTTTAVITSS